MILSRRQASANSLGVPRANPTASRLCFGGMLRCPPDYGPLSGTAHATEIDPL